MNYCSYCARKCKVTYNVDGRIFDTENCIIDYFRTYPERVTEAVRVYFDKNKLKLKAN